MIDRGSSIPYIMGKEVFYNPWKMIRQRRTHFSKNLLKWTEKSPGSRYVSGDQNHNTGFESGFRVDSEPRLEEPRIYQVVLHNDHYTTMDFVVNVLMKIFQRPA